MKPLTAQELHDLRNELVALDTAVLMAYARICAEKGRIEALPQLALRNRIANALAMIATLYAYSDTEVDFNLREVERSDFADALFDEGGRTLVMQGKVRAKLAIRSPDLERAITMLSERRDLCSKK